MYTCYVYHYKHKALDWQGICGYDVNITESKQITIKHTNKV